MFVQNGWDTKRFERVLTPKVERVYITDDGHAVTQYASMPEPTPGIWTKRGDIVHEMIGDALDDIGGEG